MLFFMILLGLAVVSTCYAFVSIVARAGSMLTGGSTPVGPSQQRLKTQEALRLAGQIEQEQRAHAAELQEMDAEQQRIMSARFKNPI